MTCRLYEFSCATRYGLRLLSMPIKREFRWLYPIDWPQLTAAIRFVRAKGRCERCDRPHGELITHLGDGRWWDATRACWKDGDGKILARMPALADGIYAVKTTRVFLATAHMDHDPSNNRARNLKAFCQRCHLLNDRREHQRRRWLTLHMRKAAGDLFLGIYRSPTS